LRHLYHAGEILAAHLHTLHNLYYYHRLMESCRQAIQEGCFGRLQATWSSRNLAMSEEEDSQS
jgi:queuine tRNA-ribosyltransferase